MTEPAVVVTCLLPVMKYFDKINMGDLCWLMQLEGTRHHGVEVTVAGA